MKDYTKSKIKGFSFYLLFLMLLGLFIISIFIKRALEISTESMGGFLILLLFIFLIILALKFIKDIKFIIIDDNKLKYYSILRPWGKTLHFDNFTGKIIVKETGSGGSYNVVYLVDKQNRTAFKITGLHYKKFGKIIRAIPLKAIDFNPTIGQYFKLAFFERITVENKENKNQGNKKLNNILVAMQIITVIGLALFFIGTIIKMAIKLG